MKRNLPSAVEGDSRPVFWRELYWFALICLGGWILAVGALTPRLARNRRAHDMERDLRREVSALAQLEEAYPEAIRAVENDPFYRTEVYRTVLGVKKKSEEYLKEPDLVSDN